jgi:signal transduction histidine kinase
VFHDFRGNNDRYVFLWDLDGKRFVYPPDPGRERQNVLYHEDAGGKPIGRRFVEMGREG